MSGKAIKAGVAKALRWAALPWWLIRIFSEEKSFHPNPILGSLALNRRGLRG